MVEHVPYTVVAKYPGFELRDYPSHALVSVDVPGDSSSSSSRGFGPLFRYISGDNAASQPIAMTAPVLQEPRSQGQYRVSFAMPRDMALEDIPAPRGSALSVNVVPHQQVAALRFRGSVDDRTLQDKTEELLGLVATAGLIATGPVLSARYDPPMMPAVFRRNEVLVAVAQAKLA